MARSIIGLLALTGVIVVPATDALAELKAHRAAYDLSLARGEASSGVLDATGALVVEYRRECDGWESRQRLGFVADTEEGDDFSYDVHSTNWESHDHSRLRFAVEYFQGDKKFEEFRGQASIADSSGAGVADFDIPAFETVELPAGTQFPTEHVMTLIEAAQSGESIVTRELFTGSGPEALMSVTAVITREVEAEDEYVRGWAVRLAFFPVDSSDMTPASEISYFLGDDGVIDDVEIDYGDFALKGERVSLEFLDHPECG